jgi:hypothetical protein
MTKPCHSPYCECQPGRCTHPGFHDARAEPLDLKPVKRKKREVRESDIEANHMAGVKVDGGESLKFTSPARRSVPDRIDLYGIARMVPVLDKVLREARDWFPTDKEMSEMCRRLLSAGIEFTECKKPGEKPTPAQLREHARLEVRGFTVNVVDAKRSK